MFVVSIEEVNILNCNILTGNDTVVGFLSLSYKLYTICWHSYCHCFVGFVTFINKTFFWHPNSHITYVLPHLTSSLCPEINARGFYLTKWDAPNELEEKTANAAATAEERDITYHKVSQSHLPTPAGVERKQRPGRVEAVGGSWPERRGGLGDTSKTNVYRNVCQCDFSSLSLTLTLWSRKERSRAWRCRWRCWSSL